MFWFDNNLEREQQWQHFRSMNGTKQVIALLLKYHDLFDLFCDNDYTKQHENIKDDISKQMNLSL